MTGTAIGVAICASVFGYLVWYWRPDRAKDINPNDCGWPTDSPRTGREGSDRYMGAAPPEKRMDEQVSPGKEVPK